MVRTNSDGRTDAHERAHIHRTATVQTVSLTATRLDKNEPTLYDHVR